METDCFQSSKYVSLEDQYIWIKAREQYILRQLDVRVGDEEEPIATNQQATVREEFAKPTKKRQGTTDWAYAQYQQFDRGKSDRSFYFSRERTMCSVHCVCLFSSVFPFCVSLRCLSHFPLCPRSRYNDV